jgi:hypothetical protein
MPVDDEGNLGGQKGNKSEKQYSQLQKKLREAGRGVGEVLLGRLERGGRGVRVKERGKIGGWHRFPFIIPTTRGSPTDAGTSQLSHITHVSFFSSPTTIYKFKPQVSPPNAPPGWGHSVLLFFVSVNTISTDT